MGGCFERGFSDPSPGGEEMMRVAAGLLAFSVFAGISSGGETFLVLERDAGKLLVQSGCSCEEREGMYYCGGELDWSVLNRLNRGDDKFLIVRCREKDEILEVYVPVYKMLGIVEIRR